MRTISLRKFVDEQGLVAAAGKIGVSPPAIHKALSTGRSITVSVLLDGQVVAAEEVKPFPSKARQAS